MTNNIWQFPLPHGLKAKNALAVEGASSSERKSKRKGRAGGKREVDWERVEGTTRVHAIAQSLDSETFLEYLIRKLKIVEMPATLIISSHYPLPYPLSTLLSTACHSLLASCRRLLAARIQSLGRLSVCFTVRVSVSVSELFVSACVSCHRPNNFCQCIF